MTNALQERAMLVNLSISAWTASKKDNKASDSVKSQAAANTKAGWFNKRLIDPTALQPLGKLEGRCRDMHYKFTLAWGDNGDRILPAAAYFDYTEQLRGLRAEYEAAVDQFCRDYPQLVQDARLMLGTMYDPNDYPAVGSIKQRFGIRTVFTPVPDAEDFRVSVGAAAVEEIKKSITDSVNARLVGATRDCWVRLEEAVKAIHERLSDPDAVFRDSLIENLSVLLDLLPKLNITGDQKLNQVVKQCRDWLITPPDNLRGRRNVAFRALTAEKAGEILKDITPWTTTEPTTV